MRFDVDAAAIIKRSHVKCVHLDLHHNKEPISFCFAYENNNNNKKLLNESVIFINIILVTSQTN